MKKRALFIAEKSWVRTKAEAVYKKHMDDIPYDITFFEQHGHLMTLLLPDEMDEEMKKWSWDTIPFHPEEHGGWRYKVIEEQKKGKFLTAKERCHYIYHELQSGKYDCVINAGDADAEGELLIRIVLSSLKNTLPILRFWNNDATEQGILDSFLNLRDDNKDPFLVNLLAAAYGRQHSDWRFGMNLSRAASLAMNARVATGRVMTPILGLVCKRMNDIRDFVPSSCYGVKTNYAEKFSGQLYEEPPTAEEENAKPVEEEKNEKEDEAAGLVWFETEEEAKKLIASLPKQGTIASYTTKRTKSFAPKLFKLATVQSVAGKYGLNPQQTLDTIQGLYEKGYLSYPRTECEYLSKNENLPAMLKSAMAVPELIPYIKTIDATVINKAKATKKWFDDEKRNASGHTALVPTVSAPDFTALSSNEQTIYTLICRQFVAIFLPPLVQDKVTLLTDVDGNTFRSTGKAIVDPGYTAIFHQKMTDTVIPEHKEGDVLSIDDYEVVTKTTVCPTRFTESELILVCENPVKYLEDETYKKLGKKLKIGTAATRSSIIEELVVRDKYLQRVKEGKTTYIVPTVNGAEIYENIKDCKICKVDLTGEWEIRLQEIREGRASLKDFEAAMIKDVNAIVADVKTMPMKPLSSSRSSERKAVAPCPTCGATIMSGPKGFYCSAYKAGCKMGAYKLICDSTITDKEFADMLQGREITKTLKKGSRSWSQRLKYNFEEHKFDFVNTEEETAYVCPSCQSPMTDTGNVLKCANGCFSFWKTACGVKLTDAMIESFFETGTTGEVRGMKGKSGKPFNAEIILRKDKSGTEFRFAQR